MHEFEMITIMLWLKRFLDQLCTRSIAWKCSFLLVGSVSRFLCEFGVILWFMTSLLVLSFSSNRNISFLHSLLLFFSFSLPPFYPPGRMCSGLAHLYYGYIQISLYRCNDSTHIVHTMQVFILFLMHFLHNGSLLLQKKWHYWIMQFLKLRKFYLLKLVTRRKWLTRRVCYVSLALMNVKLDWICCSLFFDQLAHGVTTNCRIITCIFVRLPSMFDWLRYMFCW